MKIFWDWYIKSLVLHQRQYCYPKGHRAIFGDIFGCLMGGVSKFQVALNLLPWPGETTPQTKTWPRMSFLQRLRSPALETQVLVVCAAACSLFSQRCNTPQFCQERTEHPFATRLKSASQSMWHFSKFFSRMTGIKELCCLLNFFWFWTKIHIWCFLNNLNITLWLLFFSCQIFRWFLKIMVVPCRKR